jgi:hypothetical protein
MTDAELEAIRQRAENATPGPWVAEYGGADWRDRIIFVLGGENTLGKGVRAFIVRATDMKHADALFIAHAREDIPVLLNEIKRLTDAIAPTRGRPMSDR